VAKATGVPLAKVATRVMLGATLAQLRAEGLLRPPVGGHIAVKEAVLPFNRFPEVDPALGPEMRSTGEVMGIAGSFGKAFYKAELSAGTILPTEGTVFLSLADPDKPAGLVVAQRLRALGLGIAATAGTAEYLERFGSPVDQVLAKVQDGDGGLTAVDLIGDYARGFGSLTDEQAKSMAKDYFAIEKDRLRVRKKYFKKFRKIVGDKKAVRFLQVENKMDAIVRFGLAEEIPLMR